MKETVGGFVLTCSLKMELGRKLISHPKKIFLLWHKKCLSCAVGEAEAFQSFDETRLLCQRHLPRVRAPL